MPDGWTCIKQENINNSQENIRRGQGVIYCVMLSNHLKIGSSSNPLARYKTFIHEALYHDADIGDFYYSPFHYNYRNNERKMHLHFHGSRTKFELFNIYPWTFLSTAEQECTFLKDIKQMKTYDLNEYDKTARRKNRKQNPLKYQGTFITGRNIKQPDIDASILITLTPVAFAIYQMYLSGTPSFQIAEILDISKDKVTKTLIKIHKNAKKSKNNL